MDATASSSGVIDGPSKEERVEEAPTREVQPNVVTTSTDSSTVSSAVALPAPVGSSATVSPEDIEKFHALLQTTQDMLKQTKPSSNVEDMLKFAISELSALKSTVHGITTRLTTLESTPPSDVSESYQRLEQDTHSLGTIAIGKDVAEELTAAAGAREFSMGEAVGAPVSAVGSTNPRKPHRPVHRPFHASKSTTTSTTPANRENQYAALDDQQPDPPGDSSDESSSEASSDQASDDGQEAPDVSSQSSSDSSDEELSSVVREVDSLNGNDVRRQYRALEKSLRVTELVEFASRNPEARVRFERDILKLIERVKKGKSRKSESKEVKIEIAIYLCALGRTTPYQATESTPDSLRQVAKGLSVATIDSIAATAKQTKGTSKVLETTLMAVARGVMSSDDGGHFSQHCHNFLNSMNIPLRMELLPPGAAFTGSPVFHEIIMSILQDLQAPAVPGGRDSYANLLRLVVAKGTQHASASLVNGNTTASAVAPSGLAPGEAGTVCEQLYKKRLNFFRAFGLLSNVQAVALQTWARNMSIACDSFYQVLSKTYLLKNSDHDRIERLKSDIATLKRGSALPQEMRDVMMLNELETVLEFSFPLRYVCSFIQKGQNETHGAGRGDQEKLTILKAFQDFRMAEGESPQTFVDRWTTAKRSVQEVHAQDLEQANRFISDRMSSDIWKSQVLNSIQDNHTFYLKHHTKADNVIQEMGKITPYLEEWNHIKQSGAGGILPVLSNERMEELFALLSTLTVKGIERTRDRSRAKTAALSNASGPSPQAQSKKSTGKQQGKKADKTVARDPEPTSDKFFRPNGGYLVLRPNWRSDWSTPLVNEQARQLSLQELQQIGGRSLERYNTVKATNRKRKYIYDALLLERVLNGEISPVLPGGVRVAIPQPQNVSFSDWNCRKGCLKQRYAAPAIAPQAGYGQMPQMWTWSPQYHPQYQPQYQQQYQQRYQQQAMAALLPPVAGVPPAPGAGASAAPTAVAPDATSTGISTSDTKGVVHRPQVSASWVGDPSIIMAIEHSSAQSQTGGYGAAHNVAYDGSTVPEEKDDEEDISTRVPMTSC